MKLIDGVAEMLPKNAALAGGGLDLKAGFLFPEEEAMIAGAVEKRRREFLAGRSYARQALSELGCGPVAILSEPSRAPIWPPGFIGSISHSASFCAAIAAHTSDIAAIGLDLESDVPLDVDLVPVVCLEADLDGRLMIERSLGVDLPKLIFVIKEAFYKSYYPMAGSFLDFTDVAVRVDTGSRGFDALLVNAERPSFGGRRQISGKFGHVEAILFAISHVCAFPVTGFGANR